MTTTEETKTPITPAEERELEKEFYEAQPLRAACGLCEWFYEGTAASARDAATAHRMERHPEIASKRRSRRKTRSLRSFRTAEMSKEDQDDIEKERRRRAFLAGIEIEE